MAYLTRWRLELGAEMLQTADDTLAGVAAAVGYGSEASFNRAFKREFGSPPAQYRRRQLAKPSDAKAIASEEFSRAGETLRKTTDGTGMTSHWTGSDLKDTRTAERPIALSTLKSPGSRDTNPMPRSRIRQDGPFRRHGSET